MKTKFFATLLSSALVLAACNGDSTDDNGTNDEHDDHEMHEDSGDSEVAVLKVELTAPETANVGEEVEISAHVTYGGEDEEEADRVMFEVLLDEESLDEIEAEHDEGGVYTIQYTFEEEGEYEVIAHTDAHDLHTMPRTTVSVEE